MPTPCTCSTQRGSSPSEVIFRSSFPLMNIRASQSRRGIKLTYFLPYFFIGSVSPSAPEERGNSQSDWQQYHSCEGHGNKTCVMFKTTTWWYWLTPDLSHQLANCKVYLYIYKIWLFFYVRIYRKLIVSINISEHQFHQRQGRIYTPRVLREVNPIINYECIKLQRILKWYKWLKIMIKHAI